MIGLMVIMLMSYSLLHSIQLFTCLIECFSSFGRWSCSEEKVWD